MPVEIRELGPQGIRLPRLAAEQPEPAAGCCGGAAPQGADACCVLDAEVKSAGGSGCGCGTDAPAPSKKSGCC